MSTKAFAWARQVRGITGTQKLVLLVLADSAGAAGDLARPTVKALAEDAGLGERAVRYALASLEAAGLIRQTNGAEGSRRLVLLMRPGSAGEARP